MYLTTNQPAFCPAQLTLQCSCGLPRLLGPTYLLIAAADALNACRYQPGRQPLVTAIIESLLNLPHRLYQVHDPRIAGAHFANMQQLHVT